MKTLKVLLIIICFVFFANISRATEYYCGDATYNYDCANLYDSAQTAKQKCKWLKTDMIISDMPLIYTYEQCINNFNAAKAKFNKGMCTPVIVREHLWKGHKCQVKSILGTTKVIKTSCNTENPDFSEDAMDYFEKIYRGQDNYSFEVLH